MALTSKPSTGQPLPSNPYPAENSSHTAYERCLKLERCSDRHTPVEESIMEDMPPIVAARVLGHGLLLAPNDAGHNALVQDILACAQEQRMLAALAHLYVHGLIRACTSSPYASSPLDIFRRPQSTIPRALHLLSFLDFPWRPLYTIQIFNPNHHLAMHWRTCACWCAQPSHPSF